MNGLILGQINPNLVDAYNPNGTYQSGEYCIKNDILYKANQNIDTPEEFTAEHWTKTTVGKEINEVKNEITNINTELESLNSNKVIETIYNGQIQLNQKIPADFSKYAIFYMRIVCTGYASASCELPAIKGAACDFSGVIPQRPGYNIAGTFYIENSNEISVIGLHGGTEISNPEWTIQIWGINF